MVGNTKTGKMMHVVSDFVNNISSINTPTLRTTMPCILGLAILAILIKRLELWVTGTLSPLARKQLKGPGIKVAENVDERINFMD